MGLLDKLWDDTVAGPQPETGLGKLRKYNTFSFRPNSGKDQEGGSGGSYGEESPMGADNTEGMKVTRSIMIVKPPGYNSGSGSAPVSPAGSITPTSPFSDQEGSDFGGDRHQMRMRRKQQMRDSEALLLLKMSDI